MVITTTPVGDQNRDLGLKTKIKSFKCWRFPGKPKFVVVFPEGLEKIISDFKPDTIWIHTIGTLGMKVARIAKKKYNVVYTKHCFDGDLWNSYLNIHPAFHWFFNKVSQTFEKQILKASNKQIYHLPDVSKVNKNKYFRKIVNMPPPINARFFNNKNPETDKKEKLIFGFSGRADPDKGIENTFKGLKIFQQLHKDIPFQFMFIGDGPEAHRMKKKYPEMDIQTTGFVKDVIPYLDQLDAFILSSLQETISLASLEAYARGVPVFSVAIGFLYEYRDKLINYHLFETPEELAEQLYNYLIINNMTHEKKQDSKQINSFLIDYSKLYSMINMG
jgi:glycosyltransferase involved in cell wall biosynthesis